MLLIQITGTGQVDSAFQNGPDCLKTMKTFEPSSHSVCLVSRWKEIYILIPVNTKVFSWN